MQTALAAAGIPHRVLGSLGLYERSEVRDALAYLTLIANPADAQAFRRAVGAPRRGVGERTAGQIVARARERHDGDLIAASANVGDARRDRLAQGARAARAVRRTGSSTSARSCEAERSLGHVAIAVGDAPGRPRTPTTSGWPSTARPPPHDATPTGCSRTCGRCAAPCRPTRSATHSPTLSGFLEHARGLHARELSAGQEDRRITLSTIHRAKGTEAALVVLAGCEERLLPSWRSLETLRAAAGGTATVLRRVHAGQGPPVRDARRELAAGARPRARRGS